MRGISGTIMPKVFSVNNVISTRCEVALDPRLIFFRARTDSWDNMTHKAIFSESLQNCFDMQLPGFTRAKTTVSAGLETPLALAWEPKAINVLPHNFSRQAWSSTRQPRTCQTINPKP